MTALNLSSEAFSRRAVTPTVLRVLSWASLMIRCVFVCEWLTSRPAKLPPGSGNYTVWAAFPIVKAECVWVSVFVFLLVSVSCFVCVCTVVFFNALFRGCQVILPLVLWVETHKRTCPGYTLHQNKKRNYFKLILKQIIFSYLQLVLSL